MGYIRTLKNKKGTSYYAEVHVDGKRNYKSFHTKADAREWVKNQEDDGILTKKSMHNAFDRYKKHCESLKGCQPALSRLKSLKELIPPIPLEDFNLTAYNKWKEKRTNTGVGNNSINRESIMLKHMLKLCVEDWGWLHKHPIPKVKRLKDNPPRMRGITQEEIDTILENLKSSIHGEQISILFLLAIETGMRLGELLSLKWKNVHPNYVHLEETKNGDSRNVPLSDKSAELIQKRKGFDEDKVFVISQQNASKTFARHTHPIENIRFHDSRSAAATRLAQKFSPIELAKVLGHRDLNSILIYYKDDVEALAAKLK